MNCLEVCLDGHYGDNFTLKCLRCDPICKTCINSERKCLSCHDDRFYLDNEKN